MAPSATISSNGEVGGARLQPAALGRPAAATPQSAITLSSRVRHDEVGGVKDPPGAAFSPRAR